MEVIYILHIFLGIDVVIGIPFTKFAICYVVRIQFTKNKHKKWLKVFFFGT